MKELLTWLYGKSARNSHIREMAKKAILILKEQGSMEYKELAEALGIEFNQYKKPKRTFYFVINPLKKIQNCLLFQSRCILWLHEKDSRRIS